MAAASRRPDADASRRMILDAARGCFAAAGFAGTSMSDIASAAGVTQSLIHHHFGPKETLWREVRTAAVREYHERIAAAIGSEGPTRAAMRDLFGYLAEHPDVMRLWAWARLAGEESSDADAAARGKALEAIARAQAEGRLRPGIGAEHLLVAFTGLVRGWFADRNLVQEDVPPQALKALDSGYLEAAWAVFADGALRPES